MLLKPFFCSHHECAGEPMYVQGNASKKLCPRHNNERLRNNRAHKLKKRSYKPWSATRQKIKVKDWRDNPRKILDNLVSRFILKKYSPRCYTCDQPAKENGHYEKRRHDQTRWLEDNCRPQCLECNRDKDGNKPVFREILITEIGEARVLEVERLAKTHAHFSKNDIKELLEIYENKMKNL